MNNNSESPRSIIYIQKKILELTQQYYQAIRNNIPFENIKVIFLKRKKLQSELSGLKRGRQQEDDANEELDTGLTL